MGSQETVKLHLLRGKALTADSELGQLLDSDQQDNPEQTHIRKVVDKIVQSSRLKELKSAVKQITDENAIIIEGLHRGTKAIKKNSKDRGVSKNGKKW